ncbi:hypothetical protein HDV00_010784 [Rhizophlyctis rosea]|nr:hypothetical protein HDV00_010784 [Rhizophlyctis rosea]
MLKALLTFEHLDDTEVTYYQGAVTAAAVTAAESGHLTLLKEINDFEETDCGQLSWEGPCKAAAEWEDLTMIEYLLKRRAEYGDGENARQVLEIVADIMQSAAGQGHMSVVEWMMAWFRAWSDEEGDWEDVDYFPRAVLKSAKGGHLPNVQFLIPYLSRNELPAVIREALKEAAKHGNLSVVEYLLMINGDLMIVAREKLRHTQGAFDAAAEAGQLAIVKFFEERKLGNSFEALAKAAEGGHLDVVNYIVDLEGTGYNVESMIYERVESLNPMTGAAARGHLDVVQRLLWDHDIRLHGTYEAFAGAAGNGHLDVVKWFVQNWESLNASATTAMQAAAENGHLPMVEYLLGADIGAEAKDGVVEAARKGHVEVVEYLLKTYSVLEEVKDGALCEVAKTWHITPESERDHLVRIMRSLLLDGASQNRAKEENRENAQYLDEALLNVSVAKPADPAETYQPKLEPGWMCKHEQSEHSYFISYRVAADADIAVALHGHLMEMDPNAHIFRDKECLVPAQSWETGFMQGLLRSKVVIVLCSSHSLERVRAAHWEADNMLLEWEHALKMTNLLDDENRPRTQILPILITRGDEPSFRFGVDYPKWLHRHEKSPHRRTIYDTVTTISGLQGVQINRNNLRVGFEKISEALKARTRSNNSPGQIEAFTMKMIEGGDVATCKEARELLERLLSTVSNRILKIEETDPQPITPTLVSVPTVVPAQREPLPSIVPVQRKEALKTAPKRSKSWRDWAPWLRGRAGSNATL